MKATEAQIQERLPVREALSEIGRLIVAARAK
jgi:hypothetical protein